MLEVLLPRESAVLSGKAKGLTEGISQSLVIYSCIHFLTHSYAYSVIQFIHPSIYHFVIAGPLLGTQMTLMRSLCL